jgi:hypothetical protein
MLQVTAFTPHSRGSGKADVACVSTQSRILPKVSKKKTSGISVVSLACFFFFVLGNICSFVTIFLSSYAKQWSTTFFFFVVRITHPSCCSCVKCSFCQEPYLFLSQFWMIRRQESERLWSTKVPNPSCATAVLFVHYSLQMEKIDHFCTCSPQFYQ